MVVETPKANTKFLRLAIVISIISSAVSAYLLLRLNGIVHGQLYSYGLQFSLGWATPYWDIERLVYASFAAPSLVGGLALVHSFLKTNKNKVPVARKVETKPVASQAPVKNGRVDNSMVITCPKCKKIFGRPLNMLDFTKGQAQLVNVCPYCNYILGSADETGSDSTKVILPDKTEIEQRGTDEE
jgi:DNA-directed RNA polymerase subunit RPC12/RpoP